MRFTLSLVLSLSIAWTLTPATHGSPPGFSANVTLEASIPGWTASLPHPQWEATPLYGCTTTVLFNEVDLCSPGYARLICTKTVCIEPDFADPSGVPEVTTEFSDDCEVCIETPECCGVVLPDPLPYDEPGEDWLELLGGGLGTRVTIDHSLYPAEPPAFDSNVGFEGARTCTYSFERNNDDPASLVLDVDLEALAVILGEHQNPRARGLSHWALNVTSPQLGQVFHVSIALDSDGQVIAGDVPPGQFQPIAGGVQLGDVTIPIQIPVAPAIDVVDLQVTMAFEGRLDWDLDGSQVSDLQEAELDPALDSDRSGILDVCESFEGLMHTLGDAAVAPKPGGAVQVSGLGDSGVDGVRHLVGQLLGSRTELAGLPDDATVGSQLRFEAIRDDSSPPVGSLLAEVIEPERLRFVPSFVDPASYGLRVLVNGGDFGTGEDGYFDVEFIDGLGTPWPKEILTRVIGDPPVVGFGLVFEGEVVVIAPDGTSVNSWNIVQCFPAYVSDPPALPIVCKMDIFAKDISNGFCLTGLTLQAPEDCAAPFLRSDFNGDGTVGIDDMIGILGHLFQNGAPPFLQETGDVNGDGVLDIVDAVFGLLHLFGNGPPPPSPYPQVGCP